MLFFSTCLFPPRGVVGKIKGHTTIKAAPQAPSIDPAATSSVKCDPSIILEEAMKDAPSVVVVRINALKIDLTNGGTFM